MRSDNNRFVVPMKKDYLAEKEYRYGCSVECGGTPLRVYARDLGSQGSWNSYEDYLTAPTFVGYNNSDGSSSDYAWLPGHWLSEQAPPGEGSMFYQDGFGVQVIGGDFDPQQEPPEKRLPEYLVQDLIDNLWRYFPPIRGIITWGGSWPHPSEIFAPPSPPPTPPLMPPIAPPWSPGAPTGGYPGPGVPIDGSEGGGMGPPDLSLGIIGSVIWDIVSGRSDPWGLCNAICQGDYGASKKLCQHLCNRLLGKGCTGLFKTCTTIPSEKAKWYCMLMYYRFCWGR